MRVYGRVMAVELLDWPADAQRRQQLAQRGIPRLLVVAQDAMPPTVTETIEDWIRLPHTPADLQARLDSLRARSPQPAQEDHRPAIDDDGVLRTEHGWLALSDIEARLMSALVDRYRTVVGRGALQCAAWPNQEVSRNLLDVYLHKLRPRVGAVGLTINTVRKRGYLLDAASEITITPTDVDYGGLGPN